MLVRTCSRHATPVELLVRAVFEFELARWGACWCFFSSLSLVYSFEPSSCPSPQLVFMLSLFVGVSLLHDSVVWRSWT